MSGCSVTVAPHCSSSRGSLDLRVAIIADWPFGVHGIDRGLRAPVSYVRLPLFRAQTSGSRLNINATWAKKAPRPRWRRVFAPPSYEPQAQATTGGQQDDRLKRRSPWPPPSAEQTRKVGNAEIHVFVSRQHTKNLQGAQLIVRRTLVDKSTPITVGWKRH